MSLPNVRPQSYPLDLFGPKGVLETNIPGYRSRPEQMELVQSVALAGLLGKSLCAEAPCGTGKTFAYLVPLLYQGKRILISTAGIGLQSQLVKKDLPLLQEALKGVIKPFTYALLKGVSNYVCIRKMGDSNPPLMQLRRKSTELNVWASRHAQGYSDSRPDKTGDREDAPPHTDEEWSAFSVSHEECDASKCSKAGECFYRAQYRKAQGADVTVTNHHFLARMGLDGSLVGGSRPRVLLVDECHEYPAIARDARSAKISRKWLTRVLDRFPNEDYLLEHKQAFSTKVQHLFERAALERDWLAKAQHDAQSTERQIMQRQVGDLRALYSMMYALMRSSGASFAADAERLSDDVTHTRMKAWETAIEYASGFCYRKDDVVGEVLHIVSTKGTLPAASEAIALSATLRFESKYDHFARNVGRNYPLECTTPSPFNWATQAKLYVPLDARDPSADRESYLEYVADKVQTIVGLAKGRTLVLCSSWGQVREIESVLKGSPYTVLVQGQGSKSELVERFRQDRHSVLLGTLSLWTGVDVPGEALSCVVIDKLPFRTQDGPVQTIQKLVSPNTYFREHVLPDTVNLFAQGFGRLIRSTSDKGVAVLLDARIFTKPYGRTFHQALPAALPLERDLNDIATFLESP